MVDRLKYEYSIVSYQPNDFRDERLNIAIWMLIPETGQSLHYVLPDNTIKTRGLLTTDSEKKTFEFSIKYLNSKFCTLDSAQTELITDFDRYEIKNIICSKPKQGISSNLHIVFNALLDTYIGKQYIDDVTTSGSVITPKKCAEDIFTKNKILGTKVRKNVKIKPSKATKSHMQIDFAFASPENKLGLISSPSSVSNAEEWYSKMVLLTSRFENADSFILLEDSNNDKDHAVEQMIEDLKSDQRVASFDLGNHDSNTAFESKVERIKNSSSEQQLNILLAKEAIA